MSQTRISLSKLFFIILFALPLIAATCAKPAPSEESAQPAEEATEILDHEEQSDSSLTSFTFENQKKSAHFETSTPTHEAVLAGVPINIVIDFNFDLGGGSEISIKKDGKEYGTGDTTIDKSKLALRRDMESGAPDGLYSVTYKACWPDKSCHDGAFQFAIDRASADLFDDFTDQKVVEVKIEGSDFTTRDMKISKGTKVTWVNEDPVEHYINTDSHPAHTYFLEQNSRALGKGDSYSVTFSEVGIYPYHCSAHADSMIGNILVQ